MPLKEKQKKHLRSLGHSLKPVVLIGNNGLTEGVMNEIDVSLLAHELIKVRVQGADRDEKHEMIGQICEGCSAELVQAIGHIALIYRPHPDKPRIELPRG